jgi:hypothetical protein
MLQVPPHAPLGHCHRVGSGVRVLQRLMDPTYLNDYHRELNKRLAEDLSKQPKVSLEEAMSQYERLKQGSSRRQEEQLTDAPDISQRARSSDRR